MAFTLILFFAAYPYQEAITILLPEVVIPLILALFPLEWVVIFFLGFLSHLKISKIERKVNTEEIIITSDIRAIPLER